MLSEESLSASDVVDEVVLPPSSLATTASWQRFKIRQKQKAKAAQVGCFFTEMERGYRDVEGGHVPLCLGLRHCHPCLCVRA